ncbi:MAG: hypothetical protein RL404_2711 [Pseudomonadota bacterium]|jgi:outer membrane protein TolC
MKINRPPAYSICYLNMKKNLLRVASISVLVAMAPAFAQDDALKIEGMNFRAFRIDDFVKAAQQNNSSIKGKHLAIDSAVAAVSTMSFPNINPSVTYSRGSYYKTTPYTGFISPQSDTVSLSFTLEGAGKRSSRADYAEAEVGRNKVELDWYKRNIEGEAVMIFIDALRLKEIWLALEKSNARLAVLNSQDAQAALSESKRIQGDLNKDIKYLSHAMLTYMQEGSREIPEPLGTLAVEPRDLDAETLISNAYAKRADLLAIESSLKSADANLQMVDKTHNIDIYPSIWYSRTPSYTSSGTTYNETNAYGFSVTFPIPTSALYRADVLAAANNKTQIEYNLIDSKKRVRMEISQSLIQYANAKDQLAWAESAYRDTVMASKGNDSASIVAERQKSVDLIDARTNHLKALIYVLRLGGDYTVPAL